MSIELREGAVFGHRYRIVRCLATGGMGAVYEVVHLETERRRALKVMHPHILQNEDLRERFKREAKVAAHIESEFIVDVFDAGVDEETSMPFLVMELLRGEELGKRLRRQGRLSSVEVVTHMRHLAMALEKTHRASIVHRDIKPENLFLTEREDGPPRIKVLDFGIAKVVAESMTAGLTQSIGTPIYMAPEQFNPRARLTGAVDLYALGMLTYTLLVGAPYWAEEAAAGNVFALVPVVILGPREPASVRAAARGVALVPAFDGWFMRATAGDPTQRFSSAMEMSLALMSVFGLQVTETGAMVSLNAVELMPMSQHAAPPSAVAPAPASSVAHATAPAIATTRPVSQASNRGKNLVAVLGLAVVGLLSGTAYLVLHRAPAGTEGFTVVVTSAGTPGSSAVVEAPLPDSSAPPGSPPVDGTKTAQADASAMAASDAPGSNTGTTGAQPVQSASARASEAPVPSGIAEPSGSLQRQASTGFDKSAAAKAMDVAAASARSCYTMDRIAGTGQAKVTFASSGQVTTVLLNPPFAGTSEGLCIASKFRQARVPPFFGTPLFVMKAFTIK